MHTQVQTHRSQRAQPRARRAPAPRPTLPHYLGPDSTLAPPRRVAAPPPAAERDDTVRNVLIGLGLAGGVGVAGASFLTAAAVVVLASFLGSAPAAPTVEPSLGDVLTRASVGDVGSAVAPTAAAAAPAAKPARQPVRRVAAAPRPAPAPAAEEDGAVEMSLAELRSYLGAKARAVAPAARRAPPAPPVYVPPPVKAAPARVPPAKAAAVQAAPVQAAAAPIASAHMDRAIIADDDDLDFLLDDAPRGTSAAPQRGPVELPPDEALDGFESEARPVEEEVATLRASGGRHVVMVDGYPPMDPVGVDLSVDSDEALVYIDGQRLGSGVMQLILEAGTHEVVIRSERGDTAFEVAAGDGDAWCFTTRGRTRQVNCRGR